MDFPVLITVWMLCVATDWSTGTKIALNIFAVALLCAKEVGVHQALKRAPETAQVQHARPARVLAAAGATSR